MATEIRENLAAEGDGSVEYWDGVSSWVLYNAAGQPTYVGYWNGQPMYTTLRFTTIAVAQGSTITRAMLKITVGSINSGTGTNYIGTIKAQAADSGSQPNGSRPHAWTYTTASVPVTLTPTPTQTAYYYDVTDIVQEIISRPGWASGNAISIVLIGDSASDPMTDFSITKLDNASQQPVLVIDQGSNTFPITDNFGDDAGVAQALTTYSSNYVMITGAIKVDRGRYYGDNVVAYSAARWINNALSDNHYAECTVMENPVGAPAAGVIVRGNFFDSTWYYWGWNATELNLCRVVNGTSVVLGIMVAPPVAGDRLRLEVSGSYPVVHLRPMINGASVDGIGIYDDTDALAANLTYGQPGLMTWGQGTYGNVDADNFKAGELTSGGGIRRGLLRPI